MPRSAALVAFALALAGCLASVPASPSKAYAEKSLKAGLTDGLKVEITSVSLTQRADGTYAGTATAADGDTYDVTWAASDPKRNASEWTAVRTDVFEWTAVATAATVERMVAIGSGPRNSRCPSST